MIVDVAIPIHGLTITEAKLVRWLKHPGDRVEKGEAVLEVETDKAVEIVESPASGWLLARLAQEGDVVPLGRMVAQLGTEASDKASNASARPPEEPVSAKPSSKTDPGPRGDSRIATSAAVKASPRARRAANRLGVDLALVSGSGRGGIHIRERDVLKALEIQSTQGRIQQITARRMSGSFREAPHFYLTREVVAERLRELRESVLARAASGSPRVTFTDILIRALGLALRKHARMNARWTERGPALQASVDIGLAVETDGGLLAPVIRGVDQLSLASIAQARSRIVERARRGELTAMELEGGGFTISNLGPLGVDQFQAIINPPQCGILAVGSIRPRPCVADGRMASVLTVFLTLSVDHRIVDGAVAARFLGHIAEMLGEPGQLE